MKKKLLSMAVAGALAAPAAAFAGGPTLYGQAHLSLDYIDVGNVSGLEQSSNSSRIGVKGSFDLGGGLSAIYLIEWGVNGLYSKGGISDRNQIAGFKSDAFGTLVMGRHDTPTKVVGRKADLFWSTQLGQNRQITTANLADARVPQVVGYISPNFGPVHAFLAYVTGTAANDNDDNAFSGALIYDQGGLFAAVSYDAFFGDVMKQALGNGKDTPQNLRVAAKYKFGDFTVAGLFQRNMNFNSGAGSDGSDNQNLLGGGLAYKMGKSTLKGQLYYAFETDDVKDSDAFMVSLGWDYNLSKNTAAYLTGTLLNTNAGSRTYYYIGGKGHGANTVAGADETNWGISAGYRIKF